MVSTVFDATIGAVDSMVLDVGPCGGQTRDIGRVQAPDARVSRVAPRESFICPLQLPKMRQTAQSIRAEVTAAHHFVLSL